MEIISGWVYWIEAREEAWVRSCDVLNYLAGVARQDGISLVVESLQPEASQLVVASAEAKRK